MQKFENCYKNYDHNDAVRFLGVFAIFSIIFLLGLTNFSYGETFESIQRSQKIKLNDKLQFEKCVKGTYEKDFGLGEWKVVVHSYEENLCL